MQLQWTRKLGLAKKIKIAMLPPLAVMQAVCAVIKAQIRQRWGLIVT
jgi:hypothetical protein